MIKLKREAKVGLFALLTLAALYWGINFLRGRDLFNMNNTYYATYDQVSGVQKSAAIYIKGYKVGVISNIEYDPSKNDQIVIEFSIKSKYKIPVNSEARIYSDGFLGGKSIEIVQGDAVTYLKEGDTLRSFQDKDFLELAGSELEFLKQKATVLVDDISKTLNTVNDIFAQNAEYLNTTMANISFLSNSLNYVVMEERESLRSIIQNINSLTRSLESSTGRFENIVENVEVISDSLRTADFAGLTNNISHTFAELNLTLASLNQGDGSLGKLLNDDALYDSLVTASANLSYLLEDLKANPGRYVSFSVFGGRKNK